MLQRAPQLLLIMQDPSRCVVDRRAASSRQTAAISNELCSLMLSSSSVVVWSSRLCRAHTRGLLEPRGKDLVVAWSLKRRHRSRQVGGACTHPHAGATPAHALATPWPCPPWAGPASQDATPCWPELEQATLPTRAGPPCCFPSTSCFPF
jgi:hypothetical protein